MKTQWIPWGDSLALVFMGTALIGCAPSALIPRQQASFARAQARLTRTTVHLRSVAAADEEKVLFMQAEAYHDYRFDPGAGAGWSTLAQIAAAATDFPGFQSLAGSLDLLTLRLQSDDGAVLLWETLLDRYPQSALRPLTLYRLGWAYRNTSAQGLPRNSEKAFAALSKDDADSGLASLAMEAQAVPWKSKNAAATLSLVPGLGQGYTGHWGNGAVHFSLALASLAMIVVPSIEAYNRHQDLNWGQDWPLLFTGFAGLVLLSVDYTHAYQDATREVMEFNEAREDEFEAAHPKGDVGR